MLALTLHITIRTYSSCLMRHFGIVFEELMTPMDARDKVLGMRGISGTGKVSCLIAHEAAGDLAL